MGGMHSHDFQIMIIMDEYANTGKVMCTKNRRLKVNAPPIFCSSFLKSLVDTTDFFIHVFGRA